MEASGRRVSPFTSEKTKTPFQKHSQGWQSQSLNSRSLILNFRIKNIA